jgi:transposase
MDATTVGVDLAKNCFQLALIEPGSGKVRRERLTRTRFERFFANRMPCQVVMEACGSAHYWARSLQAQGHEVRLLPAQYVRAYVRRNKTDAADAAALIEAGRCAEIHPVPIKSVDQQALQQLHRLRSQYQRSRTARMNLVRGMLREFGVCVPVGIARGVQRVRIVLAGEQVPALLHPYVLEVLEEIDSLKQRIDQIERSLRTLTRNDPVVRQLQTLPGVGLLIATAVRAGIVEIQRFPSGRHFASWLGITAREYSTAERRRLGAISKRGDVYLRTLLVHGARSALCAAGRAAKAGKQLDRLRTWALATQQRCGQNKATVALANKLARIIWATWRHGRPFDGNWARH